MRKIVLLLTAASSLLAANQAHASCYGVTGPIAPPSPPGHICGTVYRYGFNGSYFVTKSAGLSYVKICPAGSTWNCSTTSTQTDNNGNQAFLFYAYRQGYTSYADFDFYAWGYNNNDYWGSSSKPIRRISIGPGLEGINLYMPPRPLNPTPVYPSGSNVPDSYPVIWKSGLDVDRQAYPVSYEVWYKYWPFGQTQPASWTLSAAGLPCHDNGSGPDASNECSTYVVGPQLRGNWAWYVVANLNVGSVVDYRFPNTIFSTQSGAVYFTSQP